MAFFRLLTCTFLLTALSGASPVRAERLIEVDLRFEVYRTLYADQGPNRKLPKAFVFAADGRCVGVLTLPETTASRLWEAVEASLAADVQACALRRSDEFPGAVPADPDERPATMRPRVVLVTMREDFCTACMEYRQVLMAGLGSRPALDASIYNVVLPPDQAPQPSR